jgi:hypothetical protein
MNAKRIKTDKKKGKILSELAKQLGGDVFDIGENQFEDLLLGKLMDTVKTGKTVPRSTIFKKLRKHDCRI